MPDEALRPWASLTTTEAGRLAERDPVIILPLAAIEQHGPHLPLSTDLDIGLGLLTAAMDHLPGDFPAWTLPPLAAGASSEHEGFPGTLGLPQALLEDLIHEVGAAVARCGVRRLVISNSHGGNHAAMGSAGLRLRKELGMLVVKASYHKFPRPADVDLPDAEWRHGWHGGAVETAMMLHLRPGLVRADQMRHARSIGEDFEDELRRLGPEASGASFAWLAGDLNPAGVVGDARLATAALGARLVRYYAAALADVIRDARAFPLDRLA